MARDYYEVLGVPKQSSADEIKRAYRKLARENHPDVNAHRREEAEASFKEIGEAYGVLSDQQKRAAYDQYGHAGVNGGADFGGGAGGVNIGDIFDVFFNGGAGQSGGRETVRGGSDLRMDVTLTLEEAFAGVTKKLDVPSLIRCETCEGKGAAPGTQAEICTGCRGSGRVQQVRQTFFGQFVQEAPCARCGGSGKFIPTPCAKCKGAGRIRGQREVNVQIPPGVDEGDRVRVMNAGEEGPQGAPAGDLYCFIYMESHRHFQRREDDVLYSMPISFAQAAIGDTLEVPTLELDAEGNPVTAEVIIPAGTQNSAYFRLNDKGFSNRRGAYGDQICVARVVVPKKLSERQREILREFATLDNEQLDEHPRGFFNKIKDVLGVD